MKKVAGQIRILILTLLLMAAVPGVRALASEDDNSLSSLGITTEGAVVSPEFAYGTTVYTVTVPAGTTQLALEPVPTSSSASITSITGNEIGEDGTATIIITVRAGNGDEYPYQLNVVSDGEPIAPVETEPETQPPTEPETEEVETETEDSQFVRVFRDTVSNAQNTITTLKGEIIAYKDQINLYTKIIYGLIALSVLLLFLLINLLLKNRELKEELKDYRSYGYSDSKSAQKARKKAEKQAKKSGGAPTPGPAAPGQGQGARGAAPAPAAQPQRQQRRPQQMPQYEQEARQSAQAQQPQGVIRATMVGTGQGTAAPQQAAPTEQTTAAAPQTAAAAPQGKPAQGKPAESKADKKGRKGKPGGGAGAGSGVEIDMIDL